MQVGQWKKPDNGCGVRVEGFIVASEEITSISTFTQDKVKDFIDAELLL